MRYANAADFRRALLERLTNRSRSGAGDVTRLMRQVAFERFLARLFRRGDEAWLLKGGYALELRLGSAARATRDLDLSIPGVTTDVLDTLRAAAAMDLGDHFVFTVEAVLEDMTGPPYGGSRHRVAARLDGRRFIEFPLDVGQGDRVTGTPECLLGRVDLAFAELEHPSVLAYPLATHFAEKLHAYTFPREHPTRVKDLVDLVLLLGQDLAADDTLRLALRRTFEARGPSCSNASPGPSGGVEGFVRGACKGDRFERRCTCGCGCAASGFPGAGTGSVRRYAYVIWGTERIQLVTTGALSQCIRFQRTTRLMGEAEGLVRSVNALQPNPPRQTFYRILQARYAATLAVFPDRLLQGSGLRVFDDSGMIDALLP